MPSTTPHTTGDTVTGNEHLSVFMDGEMERKAARFFARRLLAEPQFRACWRRWHLIRDYLHDRRLVVSPGGLPERITAALAGEPRPLAGAGTLLRRLGTVAASGAAAAAVAFVALIGLRNNALDEDHGALPVAGDAPAAQVSDGAPYGDFTTRQNALDHIYTPSPVPVGLQSEVPATPRQRLDAYLLRHSEMSGAGGRIGFVSYVPIIVISGDGAGQTGLPGPSGEPPAKIGETPQPQPTGQ